MFSPHKWPTFEGILLILIVVISIFSFAFFTADNKIFLDGDKITGEMVRVTGMDEAQKSCSTINTQIATAEGPRAISNIKAGDGILSYHAEAGKMVNSTVSNVYSSKYYGCIIINNNIVVAPHQYVYAKRGGADE